MCYSFSTTHVHELPAGHSYVILYHLVLNKNNRVQQGDPLGSLLFCLSIYHVSLLMKSELYNLYLKDGTLRWVLSDVLNDKGSWNCLSRTQNLKSKVLIQDSLPPYSLLYQGVCVVDPADATLLGSPIGDTGSIIAAINTRAAILKCLRERLHYLTSHDAYLLLHHSLAIPKLLYLLRTSPCFLLSSLI